MKNNLQNYEIIHEKCTDPIQKKVIGETIKLLKNQIKMVY